MPAGRWGPGDEWDDSAGEHPGDDAWDSTGDDALAHEIALSAALDRSRPGLSPDPETSARMKADFFARLEQEWGAGPESAAEQTARIAPVPPAAPRQDRPTVPQPALPVGAEPAPHSTEGTTRGPAGGERVLATAGAPRRRRARHVLPADHPDNPGRSRGPGRRPSLRRRVALVGGAAALALVALTGGGALLSRDALPGDSLYALKLMAESTGTAFTFGDEARAQRQLDVASTRLQEIGDLRRSGRTPDAATYQASMTAFDAAASEGSRLLLAGAQPPTPAGLDKLGAWAEEQAVTLQDLQAAAAPGSERSAQLMSRLAERAAALQDRIGCTEISSGVDDLGPVPASGPCIPVPGAATGGSGTGSTASGTRQSTRAGTTTAPAAGQPSGTPAGTPTTDAHGVPVIGDVLPGQPGSNDVQSSVSGTPQSGEPTTSSSSAPRGGSLLPPISLPPLLPGLPSITLG